MWLFIYYFSFWVSKYRKRVLSQANVHTVCWLLLFGWCFISKFSQKQNMLMPVYFSFCQFFPLLCMCAVVGIKINTTTTFFLTCPQVSQDGKALLDKLQRPLTPGSADSLTASANYSKAVHHVLDIIHEVLHHQRQLENIWQHRKVRLHQRLQLCVFQQDVQQVRTHTYIFTVYASFLYMRVHIGLSTW